MKDSMPATLEQLVESIGNSADAFSKTVKAENVSKIQNDVFELQQTNVVRYDNHIESKLVSIENIKRIRELCKCAKTKSFPYGDLFLGIATLFAGAFISALTSGIAFEIGWKAIAFYTVSPAISLGCFVAYGFNRKNEALFKNEFATRILECLPDSQEEEE